MIECDECKSVKCQNGKECQYELQGNCRFCHCGDSSAIECGYCGALFGAGSYSELTCCECEQLGCSDCINAECEGCACGVHYDGEGGSQCAPFVKGSYYYVMCSYCQSKPNYVRPEAKDVPSIDTCPDCDFELTDCSLEEHRDAEEGFCNHALTTQSGDQKICFCCKENLGYWESNEEYYDRTGAPYDNQPYRED